MPETTAMFRVIIRGKIEDVWREITKTDEPIPAFFNTQMHVGALRPGARLAMRTRDGKYTGVVGEILEFEPPHRFSYTFKFTNFEDPYCKVVNLLEEVDGGVQYTLELSELPPGTKTAKQMKQGGKMIVNTLKSVIETGKPAFGTRMLFVLFRVLQPISPKKCRSENWPVTDSAEQAEEA